jgi:membrane associated rhomboid family serine protease
MGPHRRTTEKAREPSRYSAPAVIVLLAVTFVLWLIPEESRGNHKLSIESYGIEKFIASPLYHADGIHLFTMLLLLGVSGYILESRRWGSLRFIAFFAFTALGSSTVTLITAAIIGEKGASCGASGVAMGALVALGYYYPDVKVTRWMPQTKHLVWAIAFLGIAGLAFIDKQHHVLGDQAAGDRYFLFPQASGTVFALFFIALDPWLASRLERWRVKRDRERRDKVVAIRDRVDELLEKITAEGFESLTRDEQVFLRQASKHFKTE